MVKEKGIWESAFGTYLFQNENRDEFKKHVEKGCKNKYNEYSEVDLITQKPKEKLKEPTEFYQLLSRCIINMISLLFRHKTTGYDFIINQARIGQIVYYWSTFEMVIRVFRDIVLVRRLYLI